MTDDLVGRLRKGRLIQANRTRIMTCGITGLPIEVGTGEIREVSHPDALEAAARIEALEAENRKLREAIKPFADCADELDGSEWTPRAPDGEWAKFRLLTDDYRAAREALTPEASHAD